MICSFTNYKISGIVSCLPNNIEHNHDLPFDKATIDKVSKSSGIISRRLVLDHISASDLCYSAASKLIGERRIGKEAIGVLVFVTQYPDYILPSTAHLLKKRLGLPMSTIAIQINEGCSGYLYGLQMCLALLDTCAATYGLVLAGDTTSKVIDQDDTGTRPIFGDAGSATLIAKGSGIINIELGSDGSGFEDIMVKGGGFREKHNSAKPSLYMNGMNVFMFGISRVPKYILQFCESSNTDLSLVDYVILHQANKMMNDRIIRKLGIPEEKALYSLQDYGNTSSASIPLTITSQLAGKVNDQIKLLASGFGVGLSWGTCTFEIDQNCLLNTIEY